MDLASRLRHIIALIHDERHLDADDEYTLLRDDVKNNKHSKRALKEYNEVHIDNRSLLEKLINNAHVLRKAKSDLMTDGDWTVAQTLFGITTSYRREEDDTLSIKLEGTLEDVPLFEQLSVLRETDLFHLWAPFVPRAKKLLQVTKIELVSWFVISVPLFGLSRDAVFHAFGCDCMADSGSVLIVASSVDSYPGADVPKEPKGWGSGRMIVRSFQGLVTITSPTSATTKLIANIDPRLALPQKLIDFAMKKMCGVLLLCLQKMARKVVKNPLSQHAQKIREDVEFYEGYLLPKFQAYCEVKGWNMPPVSSLEYGRDVEGEDGRMSGGGKVGGEGKRRGSIFTRAKRRVGKRLKERKERKFDKEHVEILLEAEERNSRLNVISPKLKKRYNQWVEKKVEDWESNLVDKIIELPIWGVLSYVITTKGMEALEYVGVGYLRLFLSSVLHCLVSGFLFARGFSSLQGHDSRRSGTLDTTRQFGSLVVTLFVLLTTLAAAVGVETYTGMERYYINVLRTHDYLTEPESVPHYKDTYAWGNMAVKRHEKYIRWVCIAGALLYYTVAILIKSNAIASVNMPQIANGFMERARARTLSLGGKKKTLKDKLGICIGKGALNKPENLPGLEHTVEDRKKKAKGGEAEREERRKALAEKLKKRREAKGGK
ncbi:hypothetical protein TrCOL_g13875 [Triparma columacea]|nr:hypothetical protein TrCOL_g13875 [Triparma columacea]